MYTFGADGYMLNAPVVDPDEPDVPVDPPVEPEKKNGIVEVNGVLYYYVDDMPAYAAGLVELEGGYIYVRSAGNLAIGSYWVTNNNGILPQGMYTFGADGYMLNAPVVDPDEPDVPVEPEQPDVKNGIVDVNGTLYYYQNDQIAYCAGLVQLTDEAGQVFYIYVRSGGQLATGIYWPTNNNGLLPMKGYDFGADGRLYL